MEHLWQYTSQYAPRNPELHTIRGRSVILSSGELVSDNPLYSAEYEYASQDYGRTDQLFNGYTVWQGLADEEAFLVVANVPVSETTGYVDTSGTTDKPYVAIKPDDAGPSNILAWKITKAADFGSIVDGLVAGDLVRGTLSPLEVTPRRILGVVEGGDNPLPGIYFRDLQWLPGGMEVFFTQCISLIPTLDCLDNASPEALPVVVATTTDLLDLLQKASSSCADLGMELEQFVTEFIIEHESGSPFGETYVAQAVGCCGDAPIESSSAQEESSSTEEV